MANKVVITITDLPLEDSCNINISCTEVIEVETFEKMIVSLKNKIDGMAERAVYTIKKKGGKHGK